ncbi:unnamed protein product [Camellia sinensis]
MEEWSKNCVPGLPSFANKPPISPKPFTLIPSSTTLPMASSYEEWDKPYLVNHGGVGTSGINPYLEPFYGLIGPPSSDFKDEKPQIPPPLSREPIAVVAPSSANEGGITVKTELGIDHEMKSGRNLDPNMDPKKMKRILSNRISAQKSRLRKLIYINDMEKKAKDLQAEIQGLNPRIESEKDQNKFLQMENGIMNEKMSVYEDRIKLSLAGIQEHREVIKSLRELYATQQKMRMQEETLLTLSCWNYAAAMEPMMAGFGSHESEPQQMQGLDSNQQAELDPALNFNSFTIDPPKSLI